MTKRILAIFVAVGMLAGSNAFASRARVTVMGSGDAGSILNASGVEGSLYVDDAYNMFYNPAYINDYKNWVTFEKSSDGNAGRGMGGFVTSMGPVNVGLYLNRVGGQFLTAANTPVRPIDLTVGGDMGVKWGLGLTHSMFYREKAPGTTSADVSNGPITIRAGLSFMGFDPFVNIQTASDDSNGTSAATDGTERKRMTAGLKYHFGEWTPYLAFRQDTTTTRGTTNRDVVEKDFGLGVARNVAFSESVRVNYAVSFWRQLSGLYTAANILPIDVSFEADAASWLVVRAGVRYNLYHRTITSTINNLNDNRMTTAADDTTARIGGTFKLGKVDMDFGVGTGGTNGDLDGTAFGFRDNLFANAALTYRW